ncbi:MAG TPA: hypothetical protein VG734_26170 [Lacunisphaera sp.]|nr:hypothetical protein [Lacunisphaera sp.]
MIGYSGSEMFTREAQELLALATMVVAIFPETDDDGELFRCHEVARALGKLLNLPVVDGKYGIVDHSWLQLDRWRVLDVYAVGRLPPVQLVSIGALTIPEYQSYQAGPERDDIRTANVEKLEALALAFSQELGANLKVSNG